MQFACGEYVCFLDSDDFFTETALEELATLAEQYQADVVHTDTFFMLTEDNEFEICKMQTLSCPNVPTFETEDSAQRVINWVNRGYNWESVTMFCKRIFLVGNQITFPKLLTYEDMIFSFSVLCHAEKFLRVPNITYIYRQRADSVSHKQFKLSDAFHKWLRILNDGLNEFQKVMASVKFFAENLEYRYVVLDFFFGEIIKIFTPLYANNPEFTFNEFIKKEFHAENAELISQLFSAVNIQRLTIAKLQQELQKFQQQ